MADVIDLWDPVRLGLRILSKIDVDENGCWVWRGRPARNGYAMISVGPAGARKRIGVHRLSHAVFVGPVPDDWPVDHVKAKGCRSTLCCNPEHLEAVPTRENLWRSDHPSWLGRRTGRCKRNHRVPRTGGKCRECQTMRERSRDRRKAVA